MYFVIVQWYVYSNDKCLYPRVQRQEVLMGYMMKKKFGMIGLEKDVEKLRQKGGGLFEELFRFC